MQESNPTNKQVFLKYCGGCNPHYNRRQYGEEFIKQLGAKRTKELSTADYILVLDGCQCQCSQIQGTLISPFKSGKLRSVEELVEETLKKELT